MTALAMILSYVESQLPAFVAIPGIKVGLTNIVVVTSLYLMGFKYAMCINVLRIFLTSILFGNGIGLAYSIAGGVASLLIMFALKKTNKFRIVTVSIVGAVAHNVAQLAVACFLVGTSRILWYFLILWITGIVSGTVIGLLGAVLSKRGLMFFNQKLT